MKMNQQPPHSTYTTHIHTNEHMLAYIKIYTTSTKRAHTLQKGWRKNINPFLLENQSVK